MFLEFFKLLRLHGLKISLDEWLTLIDALDKGMADNSLMEFYYLCRNILIKSETEYDSDDRFVVLTLCTYDVENSRFLLIGKLEEFVY